MVEIPQWVLWLSGFALVLGAAFEWGRWWLSEDDTRRADVAEALELIDTFEAELVETRAELAERYTEVARLEQELELARSEATLLRMELAELEHEPLGAPPADDRSRARPFAWEEEQVEEPVEQVEEPAARVVDLTEATPVLGRKIAADDLRAIDGIGPKTAAILAANGIDGWEALAASDEAALRAILAEAGPHFRRFDPATWPDQARFLLEGRWSDFKELVSVGAN